MQREGNILLQKDFPTYMVQFFVKDACNTMFYGILKEHLRVKETVFESTVVKIF